MSARVDVTLGDLEGPGALPNASRVVLDGRGRFWVLPAPSTGSVLVYAPTGRFLRTVGRRGSGPGEFPSNAPAGGVAAGDSVVLFGSSSAFVFDSDFSFVRKAGFPTTANMGVGVARWPDAVFLNVLDPSHYPGLPLVLTDLSPDLGNLVRAFGAEGVTGETLTKLTRIFAAPRAGRVWIADRANYQLQQRDDRGALLSHVRRTPAWFPDFVGPVLSGVPFVRALSEDDLGRLWVYMDVPKPNWREITAEKRRGCPARPAGVTEGTAQQLCLPEDWEVNDPVLEVIDPREGRVIVHQKLDKWIYGVLPDGRALSYSEAGNVRRIEVLQMTLQRP